jgi:uncharacterized Ntn-hydrolase superfamily protein
MTYSLVARDPDTGALGVAVQSHYFCVGPVVCWAEAGVGAVATQALVEAAYGPRGLALMGKGSSAPAALHSLLAEDEGEAVRQVAMLDVHARVAVHTGGRCIAEAGHAIGEAACAQANMMRGPGVPEAMLGAYRAAQGLLAERMLAALDAAEAAGGDLRGRQSAALLIAAAAPGGGPPAERPIDVRVDDHPEPLGELRRLLRLRRAYDHQTRGEELVEAGDLPAALQELEAARSADPENAEIAFWCGVALSAAGRVDEGRVLLNRAYAAGEGWAALLERLPAAGLLPDDPDLLSRLLEP